MTAIPSAIVWVCGTGVIAPFSIELTYGAQPAASTPITRISGRTALIALAMPDSRPPPPSGTTTASISGRVLQDLEPDRALAGDHDLVVERVDQRTAGTLGLLPGGLDRSSTSRPTRCTVAP